MRDQRDGDDEAWDDLSRAEMPRGEFLRDAANGHSGADDGEADEASLLDAILRRPLPRSDAKVQRWIDLLAALLVRRAPATLAQLRRDVPAYADPARREDAMARMFERDKDELRAMGIAIETVPPTEDGTPAAYRLPSHRYYLPYLALAARSVGSEERRGTPPGVPRAGYRTLGTVTFAPEELQAIADAVDRVKSLGDPVLSDECEWGARKLALELPLPDAARAGEAGRGDVVLPGARPAAVTFERLTNALARRKRCTISYYSISRDALGTRAVEPYGLFFLGGHWYLAAHDPALGDVRNFRLNRIRDVQVNDRQAQTADYDVPPTFQLRQHAAERQPWELGDGSEVVVDVDIVAWTGATRAAAKLSEAAPAGATRRSYRVRRLDAFARWLLAFAGDVVPVAPPALVRAYGRMVRESLERYAVGEAPGEGRAVGETA
jgi:predicted DNA-binding transcriptional regulator YafY